MARRARELHDAVWAPLAGALGGATRIYLCLDGPLHFVPFAAFQDAEGRSLVGTFEFVRVATPVDLVEEDPGARRSGALVVGGVDYPEGFPELPGAAAEAEEVAAILGEGSDRLSGSDATERALAGAIGARRPAVIHLATHGFFQQENDPLAASGVVLGAGEGGDGRLTAGEVLALDLDGTELVVISACNTGAGKQWAGVGVASLGAAFRTAGARNVVMSLWPVADEPTRAFMRRFYQEFARGADPARALITAQREFAASEDVARASPRTWAGLVLLGG